jgi:hypothetical protein
MAPVLGSLAAVLLTERPQPWKSPRRAGLVVPHRPAGPLSCRQLALASSLLRTWDDAGDEQEAV